MTEYAAGGSKVQKLGAEPPACAWQGGGRVIVYNDTHGVSIPLVPCRRRPALVLELHL